MSVVADQAGPATGPAVSSKLRAPRVQPGWLPRTFVLARLEATAPRVVAIQAPAGFGKTTVARQWVEADPRPAAWVALDEGDDDPVALLRTVVAALDTATPLPRSLAAVLQQPPSIDSGALPTLDAELQGAPPVILVLDDVHRLGEDAATKLLDRIVDLIPPQSTVVLSSRGELPIHLARRRLAGDVEEVTGSDLAFSDREARAVLERGLPWDAPEVADALVARAQGWPAGLQLAVLALRARAEPPDPATVHHTVNAATTDYVRQELLSGLADDDRSFLVRTAVVDTPCGALCDHMLQAAGSGERLARLVASGNLFVTGLDHDRAWYRYHHVFQDLLLAELREVAPGEERDLRRRAAAWLSADGQADQAVEQAIRSGDVDLAGSMVLDRFGPCVTDGRLATVARWLDRFDPATVLESSSLSLVAGLIAASTLRHPDVVRWYALVVERSEDSLTGAQRRSRDVLVLLGGHLGTEESYAAARRLVAEGPADNEWYAWARGQEAVIGHMLGVVADPRPGLADAHDLSRHQPAVRLACSAQLALHDMIEGDRRAGQGRALATWADLVSLDLDAHPLLPIVHVVAGLALAQQGRTEWRDRISSGLALFRSQPDGPVRAFIQIRLIAAEAALAGGDLPLAATVVGEVRPFLARSPRSVNLHAWSDRIQGQLVSNPRLPAGGPELTRAERAVLEQLATHRTLEEVGDQLFVSRNTVKSHTISIYRKLGVSGRSAAVEQARALGLFTDPPGGRFTRSG